MKNITDKLFEVLDRDNWTCQCCGSDSGCFNAHRIAQTKTNKKIITRTLEARNASLHYETIIHHKFNRVTVCNNPRCNDWFNIGFNYGKFDLLFRLIIDRGDESLSAKEITEYLEK